MHALLLIAVCQFDAFGSPSASFDVFGDMQTQVAVAETPKYVLHVYAPSWCSGCPAKVAAMKALAGYEFRVFTDARKFPAWTQDVGGVYPLVFWTDAAGSLRYVNNYSTAADLEARHKRTIGHVVAMKPQARTTLPSIPSKSSAAMAIRWNFTPSRETTIRHLVNDHGYRRSDLDGYSTGQLWTLHDFLHGL